MPDPTTLPDPVAPPVRDPLLDQLRDSQTLALSESLRQANAHDPERAAAIVKLAAQTRLHPSTVAEVEGDAKAAVAVQQADVGTLLRDHPELSSWLLNQQNAAVSHDDLPGLKALDQMVRQLNVGPRDDPLGILPKGYRFSGRGDIVRPNADGTQQQRIGDYQGLQADLDAQNNAAGTAQMVAAERDQAVGHMADPFVAGFLGSMGGTLRAAHAIAGTDSQDLIQSTTDIAQSSAEQHPGFGNDALRMAGGLAADVPLLFAGGPVARAAKGLGEVSGTLRLLAPILGKGAAAVGERALTAAAMSPLALKTGIVSGQEHGGLYGATDALINMAIPAAFGRVGVQRLLTPALSEVGVNAAIPAATFLLKQAGLDAGQNQAIELATALHEYATGADPQALNPSSLVSRLALAGIAGGAMGGLFNLPEASRIRAARQGLAIRQAHAEADALSAATDAAIASKATQRAPDQVAEMVRQVVDSTGGSGGTVYAQGEAFRDHYQAQGEDPAKAAESMGVDPAAYAAAMASGSPLPIPLHGFLTRAREEDKPLLDHLTLRPDALTRTEAGVATEALRSEIDQQVAAAGKQSETTDGAAKATASLDESSGRVGDLVEQQLITAGAKPETAKYQALVWAKGMRQLAERWNAGAAERGAQPMTPEQIFNRYRVQITGPDAARPEDIARQFDQDQAVALAPRGTSLEFPELRKQWQKAHGERVVDTSSKERNDLVQQSARVDAKSGRVYFQPADNGQRGQINIGKDKSLNIQILANADRSTFLHETGHAYLEILTDLAAHPEAAPSIKEDLATVRDWLKAEDGKPWTTDQHEQFARGFERYLMEGKAPSRGLRTAFRTFARWLTKLYQDLRNLRVELTPEVRRVFDKMLASDEEIAAASGSMHADPFFQRAEDAGMSPAEFAAYQRAAVDSKVLAADALRADLLSFEKTSAIADRARAEGAIRAHVTDEVNARPDMQAIAALQDGELPPGLSLPAGTKVKLDRAELVDRYGKDALRDLPGPKDGDENAPNAGRRLYATEGGMSLDDAAVLFGFKDGDSLWSALTKAPDRMHAIDVAVADEMAKAFPDPIDSPTLESDAAAHLADETAGDVVSREVDALERMAKAEPTPRELIRQAAERTVSAMRAYTLKPEAYRAAAEKAAVRQFAKQVKLRDAKPDQREALAAEVLAIAKERLTNLELFAAARRAKNQSEASERWIKGHDTLDARERMGKAGGWEFTAFDAYGSPVGTFPSESEALSFTRSHPGHTFDRTSGYLEQWDAIQEGFKLKRASLKSLRRRESLRQWIDRQEADGEPVAIPDQVVEDLGKRHWNEITIAEQRQVSDALRNVYQMATFKNTLMAAKRKRDLEAVADEVAGSIVKHAEGTVAARLGTTGLEKVSEGVGSFLASHRKDSFVARAMDGYQDGGAVWEHFIVPRNEAAAHKSKMMADAGAQRHADLAAWDKKAGTAREDIPGTHLRLTREQRIGMALYWGNREGRQRVLADLERQDVPAGEGDVRAVLDSLDANDWQLVKATWKQINGYWHEIASLERRTSGLVPEKVKAVPFRTKFGTMEGGYYPIKYDHTQGSKATNIDDATDAKSKLRAANVASTTRRGFTKQRADQVQGRGLRYDFGTVSEHLNEVVHDLTHRELLQDQNRLFRNETIASTIVRHYGKRTLDQLVNTTADIAQGEAPAKSAAERFSRTLRKGVSAAAFGYNATSAIANATGILQALPRVGAARTLQALAHVTGNAARMNGALAEAESRSEFMASRARTFMREVAEANATTSTKGTLDTIQRIGYWPMTQVQRVVDAITWHAGYDLGLTTAKGKGLEGKEAEGLALQIADQTVIDTQGSGRVGDLPAIMRGGEVAKFFTSFYSYFSTTYNLMNESLGRAVRKGEVAQMAGNALVLWALPAVLTDLIGAALRGDPSYSWKKLAESEISYGLGMMVGFRELSGVIQGHAYSGPGSLGLINHAGQLIQQANQGAVDAGLLKAAAGVVLAPFGLPAVEVGRLIDAWTIATERGDYVAALRAAAFGKPRRQ